MTTSLGNLERRRYPRSKMIGTGQVAVGDGYVAMECVVLDWSDGGARLRPTDVVSCPDSFTLMTTTGQTRPCQVIWRRNDTLGVAFTG